MEENENQKGLYILPTGSCILCVSCGCLMHTNLHPGQQSPHLKDLFFCPFSPSPLRSLGTEEGRVPGGADLGVGQSNAPFLPQATSTTVSLGGAIPRRPLIQPQSQYQALHFHFALSPTNHVAAVSSKENICRF